MLQLLLLLAMSLSASSLDPAPGYHPPSPMYYRSPPPPLPVFYRPPHGHRKHGPRYTPPPSPMFYRSPPPLHGHRKHAPRSTPPPSPMFYRSPPPPSPPMFYRSPPPPYGQLRYSPPSSPLFYLSPPPPYSHRNHAPRYSLSPPPPYYHHKRYTPPPCYAGVPVPPREGYLKLVVEGSVVCPTCPQIPSSKSNTVDLPPVKFKVECEAMFGHKRMASYGYSGNDGKFRVMLSGVQLGKVELKQCEASAMSSRAKSSVCYKQVRADTGKSFTLGSVMSKEITVHAGTFELELVSCN